MYTKRFQLPKLIFIFSIIMGCSETYDVPNHVPGIIKVSGGLVYTAYGEGGLIITNETSGEVVSHIFPPQEMKSIDDFDLDGNLLFVLDSRGRDYFAVFSFENGQEELLSAPVPVEGGPFNGISAVNGNVVISGGTTFLNRFRYDNNGNIKGPVNFGRDRGHPDVLLSRNGQYAYISADFGFGLDIDRFGVMSLFIGDDLEIPAVISELGIPEAGFTEGTTKPVGFPIQSSLFDDHLLVAHGGGLTIVELAQEGVFGNSNLIATNVSGISVTADGNNAYLIGYDGDSPVLVAIDLADINNPVIISQNTLPTNGETPTSVAVGSNDVYIAAGNSGIITIPKE